MSASGSRATSGLLVLASLAAAGLLARLVLDLATRDALFGSIAAVFYLGFLALQVLQLLGLARGPATEPLALPTRLGLALAVPVALLGSVFDCMGLSFEGCTPVCGFLMHFVAPVVAGLTLLHALVGGSLLRLAALAAPFALLVPNCACRNPVNAYWIDVLGRSPACFLSSFTVTLVVASALVTRRYGTLALVLAWGTNAVLMAFFVGHHYYHWPW